MSSVGAGRSAAGLPLPPLCDSPLLRRRELLLLTLSFEQLAKLPAMDASLLLLLLRGLPGPNAESSLRGQEAQQCQRHSILMLTILLMQSGACTLVHDRESSHFLHAVLLLTRVYEVQLQQTGCRRPFGPC